MRILLVADIHGNWPALRAIDEPHDICVCLGDLVDYGPDPKRCIAWVRRYAQHVVRGNHDHAVAQGIPATGDIGYRYLTRITRPMMWQLLDDEENRYLARMPVSRMLTLDGRGVFLVHATPRDPLNEYLIDDPDGWARRIEAIDADLICVGHTHRQFCLSIGPKRVVNPGSVGQPRDGDCRAAYAVLDGGRVEFKRVEYPVEETIERLHSWPLPPEGKLLAADVLRCGGLAPGKRSEDRG